MEKMAPKKKRQFVYELPFDHHHQQIVSGVA